MSNTPEVRDLECLLSTKLNGRKVIECTTRHLTAVGDNYGSTMLALDVKLSPADGEEEFLQLVAKMCPTNQMLLEIFQVNITFTKEMAIYMVSVPEFLRLQADEGCPDDEKLDVFIECYGSRTSLSPTEASVDADAVILLENIKIKGYTVGDRAKGFDLEHTELILRNVAKFHAAPIALRHKDAQLFDQKVRAHLKKIDIDEGLTSEAAAEMKKKQFQAFENELKSIPEVLSLYDIIARQLEMCQERQRDLNFYEENIFNTICHNDLWVNNVMIAYDAAGKPSRVKIFDFQLIMYASMSLDVLFFLFTSVQNDILLENFDNFLKFYFDEFCKSLKFFGCPLDDFTWEKFNEDINKQAPYELYHITSMIKILLIDKQKMAEKEEITDDTFYDAEMVGPNYYEKLKLIILEYKKRNWLIEFNEDINKQAPYELYHITSMIKILLIDKQKMAEKEEITDDTFYDAEMVGPNYYEKLKLIILEYKKRNWLIE
uniref:CHK kinase-like domain-containing protein n=1 Tax=Lutzomyia longipalpis TaxID=7200 RepID=A0A1B0GJS4_LUTLO